MSHIKDMLLDMDEEDYREWQAWQRLQQPAAPVSPPATLPDVADAPTTASDTGAINVGFGQPEADGSIPFIVDGVIVAYGANQAEADRMLARFMLDL